MQEQERIPSFLARKNEERNRRKAEEYKILIPKRGLIARLLRRPDGKLQQPLRIEPHRKTWRDNPMRRVIIESPFRGKTQDEANENIRYAREACLHAVHMHQEVPFASHLFFTQFLNDNDEGERKLGIEMGYDFWDKADKIIFYMDRGMSSGMKEALARAFTEGKPYEQRYLYREDQSVRKYAPPAMRTAEKIATDAETAVREALGQSGDQTPNLTR